MEIIEGTNIHLCVAWQWETVTRWHSACRSGQVFYDWPQCLLKVHELRWLCLDNIRSCWVPSLQSNKDCLFVLLNFTRVGLYNAPHKLYAVPLWTTYFYSTPTRPSTNSKQSVFSLNSSWFLCGCVRGSFPILPLLLLLLLLSLRTSMWMQLRIRSRNLELDRSCGEVPAVNRSTSTNICNHMCWCLHSTYTLSATLWITMSKKPKLFHNNKT